MSRIVLYFNPSCGKARGAAALLEEQGVDFQIIEYLKEPLNRETLGNLISLIPDNPAEMVRKDRRFTELGLEANNYRTPEQVLDLLLTYPELMQRPIAVKNNRALICRPAEKVLELL